MNRKPSLLVVFLTVFIDLIGFGIVVPLVPIFSRHYGASGWVIAPSSPRLRHAIRLLTIWGGFPTAWPPSHFAHQHCRRGVVVCPVRRRVGI